MLVSSQGNQILNALNTAQYNEVISMLESAILSTDLALYFRWVKCTSLTGSPGLLMAAKTGPALNVNYRVLLYRKKGQFLELVKEKKFNWTNNSHRDLLRCARNVYIIV